ncbi:MAG: mechanosensitive ion channel [Cyanobacteriota bacterium]|nr:mechanosensitive ion channel [Cyanobacteriota bacterium]
MFDALPQNWEISNWILPLNIALLGSIVILSIVLTSKSFWRSISEGIFQSPVIQIYETSIEPNLSFLGAALVFTFLESYVVTIQAPLFIEIPIALFLTFAWILFLLRLTQQFFDVYLINTIIQNGSKINEILIVFKILANIAIVLVSIFIFFQSHNINLLGLVASLGIGGLAIAFAAQKTLEQFLGGIVIYLDKPFTIDDYIGLPDGTFGRVESIGLRSTKIRTSGKGTLAIVPNNVLTQMNIENFTGAKKVMAIVYLNFYRQILEDERALIRQIVVGGTSDIFGIDSRNTDVEFRDLENLEGESRSQAQITFFILGSGSVSMGLRRQVLNLANQNLQVKLMECGIEFDLEESTVYVDSPITI